MGRSDSEFDYVVVGSGAGGGTVAARLAEAGHRVLVLEAGGDPIAMAGGDPVYPEVNRTADAYRVPLFHTFATENDAMRWDFYVRHYENDELQERDPKYRETWDGKNVRGVLYPRAGCLGGCTAHNAMILVYPHNSDWDSIEDLTGDSSWSSGNMRKYFERLESCHHRPGVHRWLSKLNINPTRHGWSGWLQTERAIPHEVLGGDELVDVIARSALGALRTEGDPAERLRLAITSELDPNDWRVVQHDPVGLFYPPLSTRNHSRTGARERLLEVAAKHELEIRLDCLVTRVLFEGTRAVGVEFEHGRRLYRAHSDPSTEPTRELETVRASREVILAGGAFNTPQLLMLSGIGPRQHLEEDHGIRVLVDLPGVGGNLQDRYEISVVNRLKCDWEALADAKFAPGDPPFEQWMKDRSGIYSTNWLVLSVMKRSDPVRPAPDLCLFALMGKFAGYFPGFSTDFWKARNYLTWEVLKGHTNNTAGRVRLRSSDPRDTPEVNFKYFDEGNDGGGEDLQSMVAGIRFVREMTAHLEREGLIAEEELPGRESQTDEQLADFVKSHAWGHHASCTCPIGPRDRNGVLDGKFRVHGTENLRVVDASVFPRIPGFFIVSAVYMVGEKAAEQILADSGSRARGREARS